MTTIGSPFFASNSSGLSAAKSYWTIAYTLRIRLDHYEKHGTYGFLAGPRLGGGECTTGGGDLVLLTGENWFWDGV
jgi:hypothetical protein